MTRWYAYAAAAAALLGLTWTAQAQWSLPSPVGATRQPVPMSYTPKKPPPDVVPGPITPELAPPGPPPELSLPADHVSAFQCENFPPEEAFFASLGAQAMKRYRLPHFQTVFREVSPNPANPPDLSPRQFYPLLPPGARPPLQDLNSLRLDSTLGPRLTLGYLLGNQAFEMTAWYIETDPVSITTNGRGNLTVPFGTVNRSFPLGFEGNNGLWVNADRVISTYTNQLGSAELNYRTWNSGINHTELILGVRYAHSQDQLGIFTNDEVFVVNAVGANDPRRIATYTVTTRNNLVALQMGGEYSSNVPLPLLKKFLWFAFQGKAAVGPNFIERTFKLERGDGFRGFKTQANDVQLGQIYEVGAYLDFHILDRFRVRGGYQGLWLGGVSTAAGQVEYDFRRQGERRPGYDFQFYHGPMLEAQFLF